MILSTLRNQKGIALITVYATSAFITILSAAAVGRAFWERRHVDNEISRLQSLAAAEAGLQRAMFQVSQNAYTGFINTAAINWPSFQDVSGVTVGSFTANIQYPNQADWVIVQATGTVNGFTRNLEGRIFLDSNLSKYLVYANATTFASGDNAQYGSSNGVDPQGVSGNPDDRTMMYFTGNWDANGTNVDLYGDVLAEGGIAGNASSQVHGDTYGQNFAQNGAGQVTNSGVTGGMVVGDGFADDTDRNGDGVINNNDYGDYHDLTDSGGNDAKAKDTLTAMNLAFYQSHNNVGAFSTAGNRYLEFQPVSGQSYSRVVEYTSSTYGTVKATYNLPDSAIVYVNGDAYVRGEIQGRVSIAASDDIMITGNFRYKSGQNYADATHSAALLAKDKLFFYPNTVSVSGILYGENTSNSSVAFDADYNMTGTYDPSSKVQLRLYGNRIINGSTNLSSYDDRVYAYDQNLKYYRPPGIPVVPDLRTVRET
ncbi:MAG TPA: hypothetical protein VL688_12640 [Verrucomicrobiae bacterium]|nr:hypothetical protein [Verrucomicrobiae bacterium]